MKIKYINNPMHPVTILVIGAGGNGSLIMQELGRQHAALRKLGHQGLQVTLMDDDIVTESNFGRQLFHEQEIGLNKAACTVSRLNRFYQLNWKARNERFTAKSFNAPKFNIILTCTDNVKSRLEVQEYVKRIKNDTRCNHFEQFWYWMDMGNAKNTGQVICGNGSKELPTVIDMYPNASELEDKDNTPSCSLAEALMQQDMYVNKFVTMTAAKLLWEMLTKEEVNYKGAYINIDTFQIVKIPA